MPISDKVSHLERIIDAVCHLSDRHCRARIRLEQEADFLAHVLQAAGASPMNPDYPKTKDGLRQWAAHVVETGLWPDETEKLEQKRKPPIPYDWH